MYAPLVLFLIKYQVSTSIGIVTILFPVIACADTAPKIIILLARVAPVDPSETANVVVFAPAPAALRV